MGIAKTKVDKRRALVAAPFVVVRTGQDATIPQKFSMAKRQDVTSQRPLFGSLTVPETYAPLAFDM